MGDDDVPQALTRVDAFGVTVMRRLDDGWCAALDRDTMRCTIYARRPVLCREYPEGGDDCLVEGGLLHFRTSRTEPLDRT